MDSKHLAKHRNDVLRLSQLLSPDDRIDAEEAIRADLERFFRDVLPEVTALLLRDLGIDEEPEALIARLRRNFGVEA